MSLSDVDLSRAVSHALRHEPWLYELELDDEGWTPVDQLVAALRERRGDWASLDRAELERVLASASKQRHELVGDRIRALYGHSVPSRIRKRRGTPPERLFHGTAPETWAVIQGSALLPMHRQFVHLSADRRTAISVGQRKSANPVILAVDTTGAALAGTEFYEGNDLVWLADSVPAEFITVADHDHSSRAHIARR